jgi:hypothetical protein
MGPIYGGHTTKKGIEINHAEVSKNEKRNSL